MLKGARRLPRGSRKSSSWIPSAVSNRRPVSATWWLTSAAPPKTTTVGFVTAKDVDSAKGLPLGSNSFLLIGAVDFLDADALVKDPERLKFTTPATANGTAQLKAGRKVLVKGLLLDSEGEKRINLTQVISLADVCGS